ncbi:MAG: MFS transporter [Microgenomates group bacterium]
MKNYFWEVLKTKFVFLWFSQLLSQITVNLINFTLTVIIFEKTSSTAAVSLIWFFYAIPALLLGPFSGVVVDLLDKRKILLITNFIQAIIAFLYISGKIKPLVIYSLIFLYSLFNQLYLPAEGSTLPFLIPRKLYPVANTIFMFTVNATFLVGFSLAGPLIRLLGETQNVFFLCGIFLLLATLSVYFLPSGIKKTKEKEVTPLIFFEKIKEGYYYFKNNPLILFPLAILVCAQIIVSILAVIVPIFSQDILKIPVVDSGLALISPAGLGALIGGILASKRLTEKIRKKTLISSGLGFSTFSFLFLGLIIPLFNGNFKIILTAIIAFFLGLSFVFLVVPSQTFIQENTPKDFYGRIYGVLGFLITLGSILPILMIGVIVDLLGIKLVLIIIGIFAGILFSFSLKEPYELINHKI